MLAAPFHDHDGQLAIELPGVHALFTTASWGDVRVTRADVERRIGVRTRFSKQVHGNLVARADGVPAKPNGDLELDADALLTAAPGVAATILTADCLPIVIAAVAPNTGASAGAPTRAAATVHAGWRGLDAGVIAATLARLRALVPDARLSAAIGPGAGPCCYEVGADLHARFPAASRGANLDLKAIARHQLERAGVATVHDCDICTICSREPELFSYRREGPETGRQAAIAWLS